jgi:hypothetical protein
MFSTSQFVAQRFFVYIIRPMIARPLIYSTCNQSKTINQVTDIQFHTAYEYSICLDSPFGFGKSLEALESKEPLITLITQLFATLNARSLPDEVLIPASIARRIGSIWDFLQAR